ncbi:hypothetical protein NDU88_004393 [Pleurodeles waltl]|uniref:Uncharacterized protein n=1 Tax=Pleurodeles waltl TaxID=8319 RepID=A0AAV7W4V1_PLEWA|nr:hypothetical protein NDU88_004393 [Pleurodeles waltl]
MLPRCGEPSPAQEEEMWPSLEGQQRGQQQGGEERKKVCQASERATISSTQVGLTQWRQGEALLGLERKGQDGPNRRGIGGMDRTPHRRERLTHGDSPGYGNA